MSMTTKITVVNGADGLTPDMLRKRPSNRNQKLIDKAVLMVINHLNKEEENNGRS